MRKLLLGFIACIGLAATAQAQSVCTPGQLYVLTGIPGVYPNPLIQSALASGSQGDPYQETITFIVPQDTTIDLSSYIGFPFPPVTLSVNYQEVTAVNGLPTGLNYQCDLSNCQWAGGSNGCLKISGTPTQSGMFNPGLSTGYNFTVPAAVPVIGGQSLSIPVPGINWDMDITAVAVVDPSQDFTMEHLSPNPFHGTTHIRYSTPKPMDMTFTVTDLTGRVLHAEEVRAQLGANDLSYDASALAAGIYLYRLSNGAKAATGRMMVQ